MKVAHSLSEYKRLNILGAAVLPPAWKEQKMSRKVFPTLFGVASNGKFKVWDIEVSYPAPRGSVGAAIKITHGAEGGKQQTTTRIVSEGKNLGKANETSVFDQAVAEAESLWKKKQDKGYRVDKKLLGGRKDALKPLLPMLAHKYKERAKSVVWPAYVQPKLNGIRCLMERKGDDIIFHSRGNKLFAPFAHIAKAALRVMEDGEILDGELYTEGVNDGDLSFQELTSMVKDPKHPDRSEVQFWNYDVVSDLPFSSRKEFLREDGPIVTVPTFQVRNDRDMKERHGQFTKDGFEGTMIRSGGNDPYVLQYRSTSLLKFKDFIDEEFEIVGAEEGVGKAVGQATLVCKTKNGHTFNARCKGPNSLREEQWKNRKTYIGKMLTVRFASYSDDGIPIFPVGIAVRDYE